MRILLLTTHLNFGGIASYTVTLAEALKKRNHQVTVASSGGDMLSRLKSSGIKHINLNIRTKQGLSPKVLLSFFKLSKVIRQFDIIHSQTRVTQVLGKALSIVYKIPYVTTCHGFFTPKPSRRLVSAWGNKTIAISEAVRSHLVKDFQVKKENIALIHNGVNISWFDKKYTAEEKQEIRREYNLSSKFVVGLIARLSPVKGIKYLISAFKLLIQDGLDAQLLLIGDGPEKQLLIEQAEQLGIKSKVIFAPSVVDTGRSLSVMDVFVLPSVQEGLGISLAEAMAASCPVVASDVGGIYSLVKNNKTGLLVTPEDPEAIARAVKELLLDNGLREKLALAGKEFVTEKFSLEEMAVKTERVYSTVIASHEPKVRGEAI